MRRKSLRIPWPQSSPPTGHIGTHAQRMNSGIDLDGIILQLHSSIAISGRNQRYVPKNAHVNRFRRGGGSWRWFQDGFKNRRVSRAGFCNPACCRIPGTAGIFRVFEKRCALVRFGGFCGLGDAGAEAFVLAGTFQGPQGPCSFRKAIAGGAGEGPGCGSRRPYGAGLPLCGRVPRSASAAADFSWAIFDSSLRDAGLRLAE